RVIATPLAGAWAAAIAAAEAEMAGTTCSSTRMGAPPRRRGAARPPCVPLDRGYAVGARLVVTPARAVSDLDERRVGTRSVGCAREGDRATHVPGGSGCRARGIGDHGRVSAIGRVVRQHHQDPVDVDT